MPALSSLLALLVLAQSLGTEPSANRPGGDLVIASDSACPSADAVRQALASLRPADWPSTVVVIQAADQSLTIDLGSSGAGQRRLAVGPDCAARAMSAALVIATWMDDLPAEVTGAPILRATDVTPPAPSPHNSAYQEIGAGLSSALAGGWALGGHAEFVRMRAARDLGWQASIGIGAPRDIWIGNGVTRWMRATASLALHAGRESRRLLVAADLGLAFAYTAAWGTGYAENRSDRSFTWGPVAGARAGIPWGRFRLWTDLRAWRWVQPESVAIDSAASANITSAILPSWEAQWSLGGSYVLP
jgi:hypothetical protein